MRHLPVICVALAAAALTAAQRQAIPGTRQVMENDPFHKLLVIKNGLGATQLPIPSGRGHMVHFAVDATDAGGPWRIEVTTTSGQSLAAFAVPAGEAIDSIWTPTFRTDERAVRIRVSGPPAATPPKVTVVEIANQITRAQPQATCGEKDSVPVTDSSAVSLADLARPVGLLVFPGPGGWSSCTAFVVGKRYVLTNGHCINTSELARKARVTFGHDSSSQEGTTLNVKDLVASCPNLDCSLLELESEPPAGTGSVAIPPDVHPKPGSPLVVIGHPDGAYKEVSLKGCAAADDIASADSVFEHYCDTEGGSSGSPVFDLVSRRLVGLHRVGVAHCGPYAGGNEAVAIDAVAQDLKSALAPALYDALTSSTTKADLD